jgi:riboflavin transporter FmnP
MNSKSISLVIAFTALATALNFVRIPVPFLLNYSYQLGDIILVIAFLLFGLKIGLTVTLFNMLTTMVIYPNPVSIIGAPYYLFSILTMILGAYLFWRLIKQRIQTKPYLDAKSATLSTACAVLTRTLIMLPMDFLVYPYLVSLVSGLSVAEAYNTVFLVMPGIILYNISVPLFVIPTSYVVAKKVSLHIKSTFADQRLI